MSLICTARWCMLSASARAIPSMTGRFAMPPTHTGARTLTRADAAPPDSTAGSVGTTKGGDVDRCGLCPQRAVTVWWLAAYRLERSLCRHHTHDRGEAMTGAGWQLVVDEREHVTV